MNITVGPAAHRDILNQYRFYVFERDNEAIAEKFFVAVQLAIGEVAQRPEIGSPKKIDNPLLSGLRSWGVKGFPSIRIYYRHSKESVRILRVLHGKRDIFSILEADKP